MWMKGFHIYDKNMAKDEFWKLAMLTFPSPTKEFFCKIRNVPNEEINEQGCIVTPYLKSVEFAF